MKFIIAFLITFSLYTNVSGAQKLVRGVGPYKIGMTVEEAKNITYKNDWAASEFYKKRVYINKYTTRENYVLVFDGYPRRLAWINWRPSTQERFHKAIQSLGVASKITSTYDTLTREWHYFGEVRSSSAHCDLVVAVYGRTYDDGRKFKITCGGSSVYVGDPNLKANVAIQNLLNAFSVAHNGGSQKQLIEKMRNMGFGLMYDMVFQLYNTSVMFVNKPKRSNYTLRELYRMSYKKFLNNKYYISTSFVADSPDVQKNVIFTAFQKLLGTPKRKSEKGDRTVAEWRVPGCASLVLQYRTSVNDVYINVDCHKNRKAANTFFKNKNK